jgi:uncharacterized protein
MLLAESKYLKLSQSLLRYDKIAVAFSGGVDSTLMFSAALETLGADRVVALYALSSLNSAEAAAGSRMTFTRNFPQEAVLGEVEVAPLLWPEFVKNDKDRCYYCKKRMYIALREAMTARGCSVLVDGTNGDDRLADRPGLRAVAELRVSTPLADVGLTKIEVRTLAERRGLSNHDLPSNSCLATRIRTTMPITERALRIIAVAEKYIHDRGYLGCRVRILQDSIMVEVREQDIAAFMEQANRTAVQAYFDSLRLGPVGVSLSGR